MIAVEHVTCQTKRSERYERIKRGNSNVMRSNEWSDCKEKKKRNCKTIVGSPNVKEGGMARRFFCVRANRGTRQKCDRRMSLLVERRQ